MPLIQQCGNCRFFHSTDMVCRRYPPRIVVLSDQLLGYAGVGDVDPVYGAQVEPMQPRMTVGDWCGEWGVVLT